MDHDEPLFTLDFRPAPAPPPPMMVIRRNGHQVPIVMPEDHALDLYLTLKAHFEGKEPLEH